MNKKYLHRRLAPAEFTALMKRGGVKINDFLFFSGRHSFQVNEFLTGAGKASYTPTMGDVMLLELCARDPDMVDKMTEIANEYSLVSTVAEAEVIRARRRQA